MKTQITALVLAATASLSLAPKPAQAGDKEWAIAGGILGGIIIGSAINESRHTSDYPHRSTTVIVNDRHDSRCDDRSGYWKHVEVRVWVPGGWITERHHGRSIKRYVQGHYECRTDRVWVSYDRHHRYNDRHDHRGGYGRGR